MSINKHTAANNKKEEGNDAFRRGAFKTALARYNESLSIHPLAVTYNNRAMTFINLEMYNEAIEDCHHVIMSEPNNSKVYYRRSLCYKSVGDLRNALEDIKISLKLAPDSKEVKQLHHDIEGILFINKQCQSIQNITLQGKQKNNNICGCKFQSLQTTCNTNQIQRFHYIVDEDEEEIPGESYSYVYVEDDHVPVCARCKRVLCSMWNLESDKKTCIQLLHNSYSIIELAQACFSDLFPSAQANHDYGFCNMECFYEKDYHQPPTNKNGTLRNPSHVLLGLYQMIVKQMNPAAPLMSSDSFPLSLKALHQAYEKNSLDAFIQQYIDDLKSEGHEKHLSGTYTDMWKERKYIIGPTRLGVNDTAEEVRDMRKKLFNFYYKK